MILVKIWNWLKLLNFVLFIKKTLVNQVYIRIWSFRLIFTVSQWMKKNSKFSQFSSFLLRSGYAISVKIWKWLNFLILFHLSRKKFQIMFRYEFDHLDRLSQFFSEWRQTSKLVNLRFLLRSEYVIQVKRWKSLKLLNSVPFIKETFVNHVYIRTWWSWLTLTVLQWMKKNSKID